MNVRVGDIIKLENNQFVAVRKCPPIHTHALRHPIIDSILIKEFQSFFFLPKPASVGQSGRC